MGDGLGRHARINDTPGSRGRGLPGNDSTGIGVSAGGAVIGKQGQADGFGSTFGNRLRPAVAVEVGGGLAGIGGIDLDGSAAELVSELHGEHIQSGLRGAVAEILESRIGICRITVLGE